MTRSLTETLPSVRQHVPLLGRKTAVRLALLPLGLRTQPVEQILYIGGSFATVTVDDVAAGAESFVLVINTSFTYTFAATAANTKKEIAYGLMKLINAGNSGAKAQMLREAAGADWTFDVYQPTGTLTVANTGTTTVASLDVSAVTTGTTAPLKGATSITILNTVRAIIPAGQYLQFVEADGDERLVKLTADVSSGSTLTVAALPEAISTGAQAIYPVELYDRTDAGNDRSFTVSDFETFNTGGKKDGVVTTSDASATLSGNFYEFCPGYNSWVDAAEDGREVYLYIIDPAPKTDWTGRIFKGAALLTSSSKGRAVAGFITNNLAARFLVPEPEVPAAPIA
jgi:hypothetical protein